MSFLGGVCRAAARDRAETGINDRRIFRMLRQCPDHLLHVFRQPLSHPDTLPTLGKIAATKNRALSALRAIPITRRLVCRGHQHCRRGAGQKNKIVEVVARESRLGALPTLARIATFKKSSSGSDEIEIFAAGRTTDVMDIQIVNATADILPGLASVKAADDPAMFQADVENFRIIGVDEDMAYMLSMRRPRIAPFGFDL